MNHCKLMLSHLYSLWPGHVRDMIMDRNSRPLKTTDMKMHYTKLAQKRLNSLSRFSIASLQPVTPASQQRRSLCLSSFPSQKNDARDVCRLGEKVLILCNISLTLFKKSAHCIVMQSTLFFVVQFHVLSFGPSFSCCAILTVRIQMVWRFL